MVFMVKIRNRVPKSFLVLQKVLQRKFLLNHDEVNINQLARACEPFRDSLFQVFYSLSVFSLFLNTLLNNHISVICVFIRKTKDGM